MSSRSSCACGRQATGSLSTDCVAAGLCKQPVQMGVNFLAGQVGARVFQRAPHPGTDGIQAFNVLQALALPEPKGISHHFTG